MNTQRMLQLIGLLLLSTTFAGCALHPPTAHDDICAQLKRQIIYNRTNLNMEAKYSTPIQNSQLMQKYRDNHCQ